MKLFTILALSAFSLTALAQDFTNSHQHLVFEYASARPDGKSVNVHSRINNKVPGHSENYIVSEPDGKPTLNFDIPVKQFKQEQKSSKSVFVATTGTGTSQGTAFLVGKNLVLTNKHVLANDKECRKFGIDLNHVQEFVPCKEVLHCSSVHDFCLIKLDSMKNGKEVGEEVAPLKFSSEKPTKETNTIIIGNALGMGIHAATYKGVQDLGKDWGHFNRAFSGNSGSPLLNEKGEILGIHYGRSSADASNYGGPVGRGTGLAVKTDTILGEIGKILSKEEMKQAVHSTENSCP
jgi:S1-C subfamily serine protease